MCKNFQLILFLFFNLFFSTILSAQESLGVYDLIGENETYYLYADITNIRTGPGMEYEITDQLKAGKEIRISEKFNLTKNTPKYTQNGLTAYWLPIIYQKAGEEKQGYLWQGNLSFNQMRRGDTKFLYGINAQEIRKQKAYDRTFYTTAKYNAELKVLVKDSLAAKKTFITDIQQTSTSGNIFENLGLKEVQNIIRITFFGEACTIPTYYYYFAWNGKEILELPTRYSVSDAGAYNYKEEFIFPAEKGGKPDRIIMKSEEISYDDENRDDQNPPTIKKTKQYLWNGKNYKQIK